MRISKFFISSRRRHTRFDCDWSSDVCSSDLSGQDVTGVLHRDLSEAIRSALRLERGVCVERAAGFSWHAATAQFLAGLAPIPLALRAKLAVGRRSVIIPRIAARRHTSEARDANCWKPPNS